MSTHRYRYRNPSLLDLDEFVEATLTPADVTGQARMLDVDVTLANDAFKPDLDDFMALRGYEFVVSGPLTALTGDFFFFGASAVTLVAIDFLLPGFSLSVALGSAVELPNVGNRSFRTLHVRHNGLGVGVGSITYDLLVNGIASALSLTLSVLTTSGSFTAPSAVIVNDGDTLSLRATKVGVIAISPANIVASVG
jgi:hypothetical protein